MAHLWDAYTELRMATPPLPFGGLPPISFTAIRDYQELTGLRLRPHEVKLLRAMDTVALEGINKATAKDRPNG